MNSTLMSKKMESLVGTKSMVMLELEVIKNIILEKVTVVDRKVEGLVNIKSRTKIKYNATMELLNKMKDLLMVPTIRVVVKEQVEMGVNNLSGLVVELNKLAEDEFGGECQGEGGV